MDGRCAWEVGPLRPGSYFYLRVIQIDGEIAWFSRIWVGEAR